MASQSKPVSIQQPSQSGPSALLTLYLQQLTMNPLRTKAITSGVLSGLQEYVAQELSGTSSRRKGKAKEGDQKQIYSGLVDEKVVKMALYGFLISGPLGHFLFEALNKYFKNRTGAGAKFMQILASNLIIAPIQNAVYLVAMAIIAGVKKPAQIAATVKGSFWPIMTMSWTVSPLAMMLAQKFLPPQLWVPFFNLVGFVFGVLANTKAKRIQQQKRRDGEQQQQQQEQQEQQERRD